MADGDFPSNDSSLAPPQPNVPNPPDVPAASGKKGGGVQSSPDAQSAKEMAITTEARRPLIAASAGVESDRLANSADILSDAEKKAQAGYDRSQDNIEAGADQYSKHNDQIRSLILNHPPLMSREDWWNSKSTEYKIVASIGLMLGGANGTQSAKKALEDDFALDKAQHEEDFKKYAAAHGIDNDEFNKAKYMNIVENSYVANGLSLVKYKLASETARAGSKEAIIGGQQGQLDLDNEITQLNQVGRDAARRAAAAGQAYAAKQQNDVTDLSKFYYKESDGKMTPDEAHEKALDKLPIADAFLTAHGLAPKERILEKRANAAVDDFKNDYQKTAGRQPTVDEVNDFLKAKGAKNADGSPVAVTDIDAPIKVGRSWQSPGQSDQIGTKARSEGRVTKVLDENGNLVEREATNTDSVKQIQEGGDAAREAGRALGIIKDPSSSLSEKEMALQNLKGLKSKLLTGSTRPGQESPGWLSTGLDALKLYQLTENPKLIDTISKDINDNYRDKASHGIRGSYKGADIIQINKPIDKPVGQEISGGNPTLTGHKYDSQGHMLDTPQVGPTIKATPGWH